MVCGGSETTGKRSAIFLCSYYCDLNSLTVYKGQSYLEFGKVHLSCKGRCFKNG